MTPKRRAELRALLAKAPEFIREDPLVRDMPALLDALDASDARERRLREMLAECTDDLEARIDAEYPEPDRLSHPVALRRYERDIAPVLNARAALSEVALDA